MKSQNNLHASKLEHEATLLRNQGKGYEAIERYLTAINLYKSEDNLSKAAGCQHMIGVCYKIENSLDEAMPAYETAIEMYTRAKDELGPGRVYRDMGVMYEYHDRLQEAELYLLKSKAALEKRKTSKDRDAELGITLAKLGFIYTRTNRLKDAKKYIEEGLALVRRAGQRFYEMTTLLHLASLNFAEKEFRFVIENLEEAEKIIYDNDMQVEQTRRLAQIWGGMAHGFIQLGDSEKARSLAKKSLDYISTLSESAQQPLLNDVRANELRQKLNI